MALLNRSIVILTIKIVLAVSLLGFMGSLVFAVDAVAPSYRLGPEDVLEISVWKDETLTRQVLVRPDGFISFPLVGEVLAQGKTVDQLTDDLKTRLSQYIPDPHLSVAVVQVNHFKIYVIGKVNNPGEYLVGHNTDVMRALTLAGGLTPYASESNIKILRRIDGEQVVFPFDYGDVISGENMEKNFQPHFLLNFHGTITVSRG